MLGGKIKREIVLFWKKNREEWARLVVVVWLWIVLWLFLICCCCCIIWRKMW